MKKLFLLSVLMLLPMLANADVVEIDGIYYYFIEEIGQAKVTQNPNNYLGYKYSGSVEIPESVVYEGKTYSVTSIGEDVFSHCSSLTSVTIPNSVTSIGEYAFFACSGLTSLTIPNSVTSIGLKAFSGCSGLTSIKVENGNTVYDSREDCNAIIETATNTLIAGCNSSTIPNNVTSIGFYAFYYCSGLTSVTIPNSVTSIEGYAFNGCSGLTSVTIPNSVISISWYAFFGCSGLTSVTISDSVISIGERAFSNCSGLTSITIPNGVTSIGDYAFYGCSSLTSMTIGKGVKSIGIGAFYGCTSLTSVIIPNNVTSIGQSIFSGCNSLTSIEVKNENKVYDSREDCNAIIKTATNTLIAGCNSSTIPNSVTSIGNYAFDNYSSLTSVTIPNSVTSIGFMAFHCCSSLTSLTIPNSVTEINNSAFEGCSGLTSFTISNSVTSIGESVFSGCSSLTSLTIPNSVTSIKWYAFSGCSGLTSMSIPNSVTSIGFRAFSGCGGLTSVTIPNSVTSIEGYAFENCSGLTSVTIGSGVKEIHGEAFAGCTNLKDVYCLAENVPNTATYAFFDTYPEYMTLHVLANSLNAYKSTVPWRSFGKFESLDDSVIEPEDKDAVEINGIYYNLIGKVRQAEVTSNQKKYSGSVVIPESVVYEGIFYSVTSIGEFAFSGCSGLTSVTIPNSVTSISWYAFFGCSGLTSVTIGSGVKRIDTRAFAECKELKDVYCLAENVPNTNTDAFENSYPEHATLHVPANSLNDYKAVMPWNYFKNIVAITDNAQDDSSYYKCVDTGFYYYDLNTKTMEATLVHCPEFKYIYSGGITIPDTVSYLGKIYNVTEIGEEAFSKCNIYSIKIPPYIKRIGSKAFSKCSLLKEFYCYLDYYPNVSDDIFDGTDLSNSTLYVPSSFINQYKSSSPWDKFSIVQSLSDTPYEVVSDDHKTLTFYYDHLIDYRDYTTTTTHFLINYIPFSYKYAREITTVVFDKSISNYKDLKYTATWFNGFINLKTIIGIENLHTDKVVDMHSMFEGCTSLESLDLSHFDTSNVTEMSDMFMGCKSLTTLKINSFNTAKVTKMDGIFMDCSSLLTLDLRNFDTSNVTDMSAMFYGCSSLTNLDISSFETSNVTNMWCMFCNCSSLTNIDLSRFNTTNVTDMLELFFGCSSLKELDLSNFNTSNVTDMTGMFYNCKNLTSLDVSNFDTEKVLDTSWMFTRCSSLSNLDVSKFKTVNDTTMYCMFNGCSSLTSLDVSNFNTSNVENMSYMFKDCSSLSYLDLRNFDTNDVTNMEKMFIGCSLLNTIYCDDTWDCEKSTDMFTDCISLKGSIEYDSNKTDVRYANPTNGYFTHFSSSLSKLNYDDINMDSWHSIDGTKYLTKPVKKGIYINKGRKIMIK